VVVPRPGGALRDSRQMPVGAVPTRRCQFRLIRFWQASVQDVVAPRRVGLYPLPPVLAWGSTPAEVGLALSRRLIEEQVPPGEARQDAMATLRVFARTAHPVQVVDRIRGRGPEMIGSPVFAGFIEEGRAMGRQEGRLEGLRDDILAVRWRRASARCRRLWRPRSSSWPTWSARPPSIAGRWWSIASRPSLKNWLRPDSGPGSPIPHDGAWSRVIASRIPCGRQ
jgi:hypothetical protein